MSKTTFIIAGTYSEYKHYCEYHKGNFIYLTHTDQLKGVKNPKFLLIGTFGDNSLIRDGKLTEYGF